jgi:transcriptional regulator of acetoin/glycerol metabolism
MPPESKRNYGWQMTDSSRYLPIPAQVAVFDTHGQVRPLAEIETEVIEHALTVCSGNVTEAARCLGIGRTTLYRKVGTLRR